MLWRFFRDAAIRQLAAQLAECRERSTLKSRIIRVQQAEIDKLSAVIERDRARVLAETAAYAKQEAVHGLAN